VRFWLHFLLLLPDQLSQPPKTNKQVAIYNGRSTYTTAPLDCAGASKPGSAVTLPPKGTPIGCTFKASELAVADGLVLPLIITKTSSDPPAPAKPLLYTLTGAPKTVVGECADVGNSLQLMQGSRRAGWQPGFVGQPFGSEPDCGGGSALPFALWFGADAKGTPTKPPAPCGDYVFDGTLTVVPKNGEAVVDETKFYVKVTGC